MVLRIGMGSGYGLVVGFGSGYGIAGWVRYGFYTNFGGCSGWCGLSSCGLGRVWVLFSNPYRALTHKKGLRHRR